MFCLVWNMIVVQKAWIWGDTHWNEAFVGSKGTLKPKLVTKHVQGRWWISTSPIKMHLGSVFVLTINKTVNKSPFFKYKRHNSIHLHFLHMLNKTWILIDRTKRQETRKKLNKIQIFDWWQAFKLLENHVRNNFSHIFNTFISYLIPDMRHERWIHVKNVSTLLVFNSYEKRIVIQMMTMHLNVFFATSSIYTSCSFNLLLNHFDSIFSTTDILTCILKLYISFVAGEDLVSKSTIKV